MDKEAFGKIKQWDIIEFQRDQDIELETGAILKTGRSVHLVAGIDGDRGFWHRVKAEDVNRVISRYEGVDIREITQGILELLEKYE